MTVLNEMAARHPALTRALIGLVVTVGTVIAVAPPASAHGGPGGDEPAATNDKSSVVRLDPPVPGLTVSVVDAGTRILVRRGPHIGNVLILGYSSEPYLRLTRSGVDQNRYSPSVQLNTTLLPKPTAHPVDPHHAPVWVHLSNANSVVWHDHRAHWIAGPIPAPDNNGVIHLIPRWTVYLRVDGRPVTVIGQVLRFSGVTPLPWIAFGVIVGLVVGALGFRRRGWGLAVGAGIVAVATVLDSIGAYSMLSRLNAVGSSLVAPATGVVLLGVAAWRYRSRPEEGTVLVAGGAIGLALLLGALRVPWLYRRYLPTALPFPVGRMIVAGTIGATVALCVIAVVAWRSLTARLMERVVPQVSSPASTVPQ